MAIVSMNLSIFEIKPGSFEWCPERIVRILLKDRIEATRRPVRISHQCCLAVALCRLKRRLQVSFVIEKQE